VLLVRLDLFLVFRQMLVLVNVVKDSIVLQDLFVQHKINVEVFKLFAQQVQVHQPLFQMAFILGH
jgi:hypothetical protein